jgi:RNA polymerase primary sigma factor
MRQWSDLLTKALPKARVGQLSGAAKDSLASHNVVVAIVNSFRNNADSPAFQPGSVGLLVADEAHRYGSSENGKALSERFSRRLALSGSFERNDDGIETTLRPYFGDTIMEYGYGPALADGVVAPFHLGLVGVRFKGDESDRYEAANERCSDAWKKLLDWYDYPEEWKSFFARVVTRLKIAAQQRDFFDQEAQLCGQYMDGFSERRTVLAEAESKYDVVASLGDRFEQLSGTLVFVETKDGAYYVAERLEATTSVLALSSDDSTKDRMHGLKAFERGDMKVLCTPRILDEGIDVPEAELAVVIATSRTKRQLIQRMGRVIRLKADGRHARLLLLYVIGTPEDPETGGHEAFLDAVVEHAASTNVFSAEDPADIRTWLDQ